MIGQASTGQLSFQWASGFSEGRDLERAVEEAAGSVREGLGGARPDLTTVFVSSWFADRYEDVPGLVGKALDPKVLIGTTGAGVLGAGREAEERPAFALSAGVLPGVQVAPFHVRAEDLDSLGVSPKNWAEFLKIDPEGNAHFLLFAHPFTIPADDLVGALDQAFPQSRKVGGLASGGPSPDSMALFLGVSTHLEGAVGVALAGDIDVDVIVAQGCRPVGPAMKVTRAAGSDIFEIDGEPALDRLMAVFHSLPEAERSLAQVALHVGVAMEGHEKEGQRTYDGGYLIRNLMGVDPRSKVVRVGHFLHEGQTIRLQLRDAETATRELEGLLDRYRERAGRSPRAAAFLFQCNGRGTNMFDKEGHDSGIILDRLGAVPLAGFFCNGEIGPVGEVTYIHGFTSSIGILRPKGGAH